MRIPTALQNRVIFALAIGGSVIVFALVYSLAFQAIFVPSSSADMPLKAPLYAALSFPTAFAVWPRVRVRSRRRMACYGAVSALLTLVCYGLVIGWANIQSLGLGLFDTLTAYLGYVFTVVLFGSLITLGLPYILLGWVATCFSNA